MRSKAKFVKSKSIWPSGAVEERADRKKCCGHCRWIAGNVVSTSDEQENSSTEDDDKDNDWNNTNPASVEFVVGADCDANQRRDTR